MQSLSTPPSPSPSSANSGRPVLSFLILPRLTTDVSFGFGRAFAMELIYSITVIHESLVVTYGMEKVLNKHIPDLALGQLLRVGDFPQLSFRRR